MLGYLHPKTGRLQEVNKWARMDYPSVKVKELLKLATEIEQTAYMAPEVKDGKECTMASDIYSIGVVFYQIMMMQEKLREIDLELIPSEFSSLIDTNTD